MHDLKPLVLVSIMITAAASGAAPVRNADLKTQALSEIQQSGKIKATPSDVQITGSGMLSLQDPRPEIIGRKWDYYLAIAAQQFQAQGLASNDLTVSTFDLGTASKTIMPSLAFGLRAPLYSTNTWKLNWAVGVKGGYASQRTTATFSTGFRQEDVRLNTMLLSVLPGLSFSLLRARWLTTNLAYEYGTLTYTQVSSDELANLSEHATINGVNWGLDFNLTSNWALTLSYARRQLATSSTRLGLQTDNYELGTRLLW